jgi:hypothetical protein
VTSLPGLPLTDVASAQLFQRLLMLHVARLKGRGEPVGFHQFVLGQALSLHRPTGPGEPRCAECGQPYPCRTVLLVTLLTRLPVPWTPASLGRALSSARLWPTENPDHDLVGDGELEYGDHSQADPWYRAERNPRTGRWLVRTYERGGLRATQHIDDDQQLCEFLIEQTLRLPYPYGWKTDNSLNPDLNAGATRAGTWWSAHRALPYLESRRSDGAWEPPPE